MARRVTLSDDALTQMMSVVHQLGGGQDLDDILAIIARTVIEVIGFDAVAINVRRGDGNLEVRAVVGPPELEELRGGLMSESAWRELLAACQRWGGLYFSRSTDLPFDVPTVDPWQERLTRGPLRTSTRSSTPGFLPPEPWQAEFALLVPVWTGGPSESRLESVISVDLPRSGRTPDPEQQMLLELFGVQVGIAITRVSEAARASDHITLYRAAFAESPLASALLDAGLHLTDINDAFLELADAVPGELDGRHLTELIGVDPVEVATRFRELEPGGTAIVADECRLRHPRGIAWNRWVDVTARRVDSLNDNPRYVCTVADRTEAREEMNAIRHRADHDGLTGLCVRAVWLDDLRSRLSARSGAVVGVLFCDLDGFKQVNDVLGHAAGDDVLVAVAHRLSAASAPTDVVCRWGGDEFAVVAARPTSSALCDLASSIVAAIAEMTTSAAASDPVAAVSISIGIAAVENPDHVISATALVDIADGALYQAKKDPGQKIHVTLI